MHVQYDVCPAHCALCTVREVETNTTTGRVDISIVNLYGSTSTTLKDTKTNNEYYTHKLWKKYNLLLEYETRQRQGSGAVVSSV